MSQIKKFEKPYCYAVKHKDLNVRNHSRSGGVFTALSDVVLNFGGAVYGCRLTPEYKAEHFRANSPNDRNLVRGSKYIQSNKNDVFGRVKRDLDIGRVVLFSGTSCEVSGLTSFLQKDYSNLLCVDIVCHGVPSSVVWSHYLKFIEQKYQSKIIGVDFRNKKDFGWSAHIETIYLENGRRINSEVFKRLFYNHDALRPSCYCCPYKSVFHPGNITIGDYWGIKQAASEFDDDKGVSLVLVNDDRGGFFFECIKDSVVFKECEIEKSLQPPLVEPFSKPCTREQFWKDFNQKDFEFIVNKYAYVSGKDKVKNIIRYVYRKIFS